MNHRESWHPEKYTIESKAIEVTLPSKSEITDEYAEKLGKELGIEDKFRRQLVKKETFKISYENHDVEIDVATGKGEMVSFLKTPIISQTMKLHKNTSSWWIYYSDIFGISLILIAITGALMIKVGNKTFNKRGWKLALAGLVVPLLILLFV